MPLRRKHFLLSYFKTLSVCSAGVWTHDLPHSSPARRSTNWANRTAIKAKIEMEPLFPRLKTWNNNRANGNSSNNTTATTTKTIRRQCQYTYFIAALLYCWSLLFIFLLNGTGVEVAKATIAPVFSKAFFIFFRFSAYFLRGTYWKITK